MKKKLVAIWITEDDKKELDEHKRSGQSYRDMVMQHYRPIDHQGEVNMSNIYHLSGMALLEERKILVGDFNVKKFKRHLEYMGQAHMKRFVFTVMALYGKTEVRIIRTC